MTSTEKKPIPIIFGDESLSDMTLVVGDQDFKIHRMVLASRSDVFKTMFYGDFKESKEDRVEIKDVSVENFKRFLEIVYTGKTPSDFLGFPVKGERHRIDETIKKQIRYLPLTFPLYREHFQNFWSGTAEILNIADRFNMTSIVKDYFGYIIPLSILYCQMEECDQCFHNFIFALINEIDVSKCKKKYPKILYTRYAEYADGYPYPDAIPRDGINTLFKQLQ